ncbi:hypothetical protein KC571_03630 [candidate division WWE3 bacterium]|uniref:Uncharacterized protein n=1 Tax=candidate division WWE3 bacterium TaxID=2053526 RepID=A0A955LH36_UNCKA|nr:hypothetical protein [candidate division WWE3 bacterium]
MSSVTAVNVHEVTIRLGDTEVKGYYFADEGIVRIFNSETVISTDTVTVLTTEGEESFPILHLTLKVVKPTIIEEVTA